MALTLDGTTGISATGNIYGGNLIVTNSLTAGSFAPTLLSSTGNVTGGNLLTGGIVSATGNIAGSYFIGNGSQLTGVDATQIINGTSNVKVNGSGGNITHTVAGTANVGVWYNAGLSITGDLTVTGNATLSGNILGDRIQNGTTLIDIQTANGNANITVGGTSNVAVFATTGAYITGINSVSGNVTGGNLLTGGLISAAANVTAPYFIGNGAALTGLSASKIFNGTSEANIGTSGGNANITIGGTANVFVVATTGIYTTGLSSVTGNITGGNVLTGGLISATSTITSAANITGGNVLTGGLISSTGTITGTSHLGAVVSVTANVTGGNLLTAGIMSAGGNIFAANIIVTGGFYDTGDHLITSTAANANIVLTPTGTGITQNNGVFSASGNVTGGNVLTAGLISAGGTVTGTSHLGAVVSVTGAITGAAITGSSLTVSTGNISGGNIVNNNANGVGNIGSATVYFNTVFGKATTAQYADLAELYSADAKYEPGTVLVFGGNNEVTVSTVLADPRVAGVVSTNPAHLMNSVLESEHKVAVALTGRVPTSVTGTVRKGDMMVTAGNGVAQASAAPAMGTVIGKALENFDGVSGTIEIVVGRL